MIIFKTLLITSLMFSASFRTPNIPTNPTDYELKGNIELKTNNIRPVTFNSEYETERNDGLYYNSYSNSIMYKQKITGSLIKYKLENYYKKSANINYQSLDISLKANRFLFYGGSLKTDDYCLGTLRPFAYISFENKSLLLEIRFNTLEVNTKLKVGQKIYLKKSKRKYKVFVYPYYKFIRVNDNEYHQFKTEIGLEF